MGYPGELWRVESHAVVPMAATCKMQRTKDQMKEKSKPISLLGICLEIQGGTAPILEDIEDTEDASATQSLTGHSCMTALDRCR
eukprot:1144043-Pelagomonas_calceolata.AAC.1